MFGNGIGPQAHRLRTIITQKRLHHQLCQTIAQHMLLVPLWKAAQDVVDLICIPLWGEQAECGSGTTQVGSANPTQFRFLTPPRELDRQDPIVELFPGRHSPVSHVIGTEDGEPCSHDHVKSGLPQALGNLNVCRNNPIEIIRETLYGPAIHASEEPWIHLHLLLAANRECQCVSQYGSVLLHFLTELLPPRVGTARCQHDPGR